MPTRTLLFLAAWLSLTSLVRAQGAGDSPVPLKRVVLFTSGVGYFERRATISGNVEMQLPFKTDDVNDLLQSMVVQDQGGGRIKAVTYDSQQPLARTLRTFRIDLTQAPTLADLLHQVRGETIEVESPNLLRGTIVSVERRLERVGDEQAIEAEFLTILSEDGLMSLPLSSLRRIRLVDERLDADLRAALKVLAQARGADRKSVTLSFSGEGERPVRVGYIQEAPVWKTSYRLVLTDDKKPQLQGWAIVENATEEDWEDVSLSLVSGRPISFMTDLYPSLFVDRPLVPPDTPEPVSSRAHDQDLGQRGQEFRRRGQRGGGGGGFGGFGGGGGYFGGGGPVQPVQPGEEEEPIDPTAGVESTAKGEEVGELFHYAIDGAVRLQRQRSAMLPIIVGEVEGEKVDIFDRRTHARHPLSGFRLTNRTGQPLMAGPITVYDGGGFAGAARIKNIAVDSQRLISYALDLHVEVATQVDREPTIRLVAVRVLGGRVHTDYQDRITERYVIKNSAGKVKTVLVESMLREDWDLESPEEPAETTRDRHRFAVAAKPGEPAELVVTYVHHRHDSLDLSDLGDEAISRLVVEEVTPEPVREALKEVLIRRTAVEQLTAQLASQNEALSTIRDEQTRIRANMSPLDKTQELYKTFAQRLGETEEQHTKLRKEIDAVKAKLKAARTDLTEYIRQLNVK